MILTGRGRDEIINTFLTWLKRYAEELERGGNRLMLAEVSPKALKQLEQTGVIEERGRDNILETQPILGASTEEALAAEACIAERRETSIG